MGFAGVLGPGALYVGVPSMDAVCSHLAENGGIGSVRSDVQVTRALLDPDGKWLLEGRIRQPLRTAAARKQEAPFTPWNLGVYDALVLADRTTACPGTPGYVDVSAPTSAAKLLERMRAVRLRPCIALTLGFQDAPAPLLPFDAASVRGSEGIAWVALDSAKPGRGRADGVQCVVALASRALSRALVQRGPDGALPPQTPELLAALAAPLHDALRETLARAGVSLPPPAFIQAHRWGAAFPASAIPASCLRADSARLVACGDFCLPGSGARGDGGGVEAAVLSARAAADAVRQLFES